MSSQEIQIGRTTRPPVVCSDYDESGRYWELVLPGLDSPSITASDPHALIYWLRSAANLIAASVYPEGAEHIGQPFQVCIGPFAPCTNQAKTWIMLESYEGENNMIKKINATPVCAECLNTYLLKKAVTVRTIPDFPPVIAN